MKECNGKLGLGALTAVVLGSMVGAGIFNLPQNMAANAGPGAVIIAWLIMALGMLLLVATFKILADRRPDLNCGIYQYAFRGFGSYAGFNIAWGYWLCAAFANVAYAVMLNDSFGAFFPGLLNHRWESLIFGTVLIWGMFFLVSSGVKTAHSINKFLTLLKVVSLGFVVLLLVLGFRADIFSFNLSQPLVDGAGFGEQVRNSMLVTLWCFMGIEGAVMLSYRSKKPQYVGKATIIGFLIAWVLYVLVSLLCYGAIERARIAGLNNPSVAYALQYVFGDWAYWTIIVSVILSILGVWVSWTIVAAEIPYTGAKCGIFPKSFLQCNRHGIPMRGLFLTSIMMEGFYVVVLLANDVYLTILNITGMMVLPAYLVSGLYLLQQSVTRKDLKFRGGMDRLRCLGIGLGCSVFCGWMIYAGGLELLSFTAWFYLIGTGIFLKVRGENREIRDGGFGKNDWIMLILLVVGGIVSGALLILGKTPF